MCYACCLQLLSHLSIPDENFESLKVKAKVGYMGMLQDGNYSDIHVAMWTLTIN